jgi:TRAP-type C4-dicarboxylate transport system permease small subunit
MCALAKLRSSGAAKAQPPFRFTMRGLMQKVIDGFFTLLKFITVVLLVLMVILVFGNVLLRYIFNSGITVSEELARWFFVWLVFLGAVVGQRERAHLAVTMGIIPLPPKVRRGVFFFMTLLVLACAGLVAHGSWVQMMINWQIWSPAADLSTAWFYGAGFAVGILSIPLLLCDLWLAFDPTVDELTLFSLRGSEDDELK